MLWKGSSTRLINNPDGMLLPGFIDTHVHLLSGGIEMSQCYLNDLGSPEEIFEALIEVILLPGPLKPTVADTVPVTFKPEDVVAALALLL